MKELQVLGVMRALLVAGMSVAEEDQGDRPFRIFASSEFTHCLIELGRMYAHGAGGDGDGEVGDIAETADAGAGCVRPD